MIEGLKVDIASSELQVHLEERAEYHREKAPYFSFLAMHSCSLVVTFGKRRR